MNKEKLKSVLAILVRGGHPPPDQIEDVFDFIMSGQAELPQIAAFLTALHMSGERAEDIAAAARIMRKNMLPASAPDNAIDCCGTGGDMKSTLNISTAVALVIAACGVPVAKHGNRAQSSKSGSADLLSHLGVNLDSKNFTPSIQQAGIGFLFAQNHHSAMRHVAPVRQALGFRTIFNLAGPLCNPARVKKQLIGVFDQKWLMPVAEALQQIGCERAWIVCGHDGMDELTTVCASHVAELHQGKITCFDVSPEQAGLPRAQPESLIGGTIAENAEALKELLAGKKNAYRDIVLLNAAGALIVAGQADDLKHGAALADAAISTGRAAQVLEKWIEISHE